MIKIEMQFLPDVYVECDVCHGQRYNKEALEIYYKDKSLKKAIKRVKTKKEKRESKGLRKTGKIVSRCGGYCMTGKCNNCPPKEWKCDTY